MGIINEGQRHCDVFVRSANNKLIDKEIFFQNHNKGRPVALSGSYVGFTIFRRAINEENRIPEHHTDSISKCNPD